MSMTTKYRILVPDDFIAEKFLPLKKELQSLFNEIENLDKSIDYFREQIIYENSKTTKNPEFVQLLGTNIQDTLKNKRKRQDEILKIQEKLRNEPKIEHQIQSICHSLNFYEFYKSFLKTKRPDILKHKLSGEIQNASFFTENDKAYLKDRLTRMITLCRKKYRHQQHLAKRVKKDSSNENKNPLESFEMDEYEIQLDKEQGDDGFFYE